MPNTPKTVVIEQASAHIRVTRLNRPKKLNAMNPTLKTDLADAIEQVGSDNRCRAVILTGSGRGFCSGLDLDDSGVIPNIDDLTVPRYALSNTSQKLCQ